MPFISTSYLLSLRLEFKARKMKGTKKWTGIKKNAIYSITNIGNNFLSKENISGDINNPMQWDPCKSFTRFSNQYVESFEEQKTYFNLAQKTLINPIARTIL